MKTSMHYKTKLSKKVSNLLLLL